MATGDADFLAERFEAHRSRLRAVAHRMLGSATEADDAVQEAWVRLSRSEGESAGREIDNMAGWLTTVVGRVCLDMLRSRRSCAEEPLDDWTPAPSCEDPDPARDALLADSVGVALLADSVGVALLVVLDTLTPGERLAFVLHDLFGVRYEQVASIVDRTPEAARQLAGRARRRVRGAQEPDVDLARQRKVVDAFLSAARDGDFVKLLAVLDPDVVARSEAGVVAGAAAVTAVASSFAFVGAVVRPALIDGATGLAVLFEGRVERILGFTFVRGGRIAVIDVVADLDRISELEVKLL
ncbi:sigma-70 family RNA polymerase sigma factor [Streptomyces sp. SLBN-115]|uniref:sigma-70 family RNA polymerase sigma factor n=1 Tax=Streptomyces sp. SLBN-115 TaxID=2768453 RepID=UPI001152CA2A|nr:sigma-70 family RNA polymerase sigma factor [Streptomyces sp. SLBN-115]TQJ53915.1 RNA polymerase sigma-70 factor (ECF subfamily) [Streptomyces sp. SLBN-115]